MQQSLSKAFLSCSSDSARHSGDLTNEVVMHSYSDGGALQLISVQVDDCVAVFTRLNILFYEQHSDGPVEGRMWAAIGTQ
eukprot:1161901-Pelagomonas_calceolata.AAC.4